MALIQEISDQIKQAMKSGDAQRRDAVGFGQRRLLHADGHGVRNCFNRGEEDVRILCRGVRREAALAAAELQLQRLMAREVLQPVTAQRLGVSDQRGRAALHARDEVGLFSHSHKWILLS